LFTNGRDHFVMNTDDDRWVPPRVPTRVIARVPPITLPSAREFVGHKLPTAEAESFLAKRRGHRDRRRGGDESRD
jgi:hypothetical protein